MPAIEFSSQQGIDTRCSCSWWNCKTSIINILIVHLNIKFRNWICNPKFQSLLHYSINRYNGTQRAGLRRLDKAFPQETVGFQWKRTTSYTYWKDKSHHLNMTWVTLHSSTFAEQDQRFVEQLNLRYTQKWSSHSSGQLKVTANLFGLEFCKILKSHHKIAHSIHFVLKKKLFEDVSFLRSYCKFCVLRD